MGKPIHIGNEICRSGRKIFATERQASSKYVEMHKLASKEENVCRIKCIRGKLCVKFIKVLFLHLCSC